MADRAAPQRAAEKPLAAPIPAPPKPATKLTPVPARDPQTAPGNVPADVASTLRAPGKGEPLPPEPMIRLSEGLGADLRNVRVHDDGPARTAVAKMGARAFAFGRRIFLGPGERRTDLKLLAHETAHVIQQSTSATVQLYGDRGGPALESEARSAGQTVAAGGTTQVTGRAATGIQRDDGGLLRFDWKAYVRENFPTLAEVFVDNTPYEWMEKKVLAAFEAVVKPLREPIENAITFVGELKKHFAELVAFMREAGGQIAKGDCSSLSRAAAKIEQVFTKITAPIVDKVKVFATKVGDFFKALWDKVGAPVWDWIKNAAGKVWDVVSKLASRAWELVKKVKDKVVLIADSLWQWVKRKLGLGDANDSEEGLIDWVKRKASEAWESIKKTFEPYKKQLAIVAGILVMLSPAGPVIAIGAAVVGFIQAVRWLSKNLSTPDGVVKSRTHVRDVVIAGIQKAIAKINEILKGAATFLSKVLKQVTSGIGAAAGKLAGGVLSFLVAAAEWLLAKFEELATWAVDQVGGLADLVEAGLAKLDAWLQPVYKILGRVGDVLARAAEVVFMVAEKIWNLIPACIRDPIVNFLVEHLLKKIPIVAAILDVPDIWARLKNLVRTVIRKLFKGLDLFGAAFEIFKLILDVLKVPVQLVKSVLAKAGQALDVILADPLKFLKNLLLSLKAGLQGFVDRFWGYLRDGLIGWLSGELPAGIKFPTDFSLGGIFGFVFAVLGVTMEKIWSIIQKKVSEPVYKALRAAARIAAGVWEWITVAVTEGVGGLWKKLTEKLEELKKMVIDAIIGWVVDNIIERIVVKLISMLDPTGIMAVVNSILAVYNAIAAAVEYMRGILEIVDKYLDMVLGIAAGALGPAAQRFEKLLGQAMPIAIGFLAYQVGLSKVGRKIREMIDKVQKWVDEKLEWLVDRAVKAGGNIISSIGKLFGGGKDEGRFVADDGQTHKVYVSEGTPELIVESTPAKLKAVLGALKARIESEVPTHEGLRDDALKELDKVKDRISEFHRDAANPKPGKAGYAPAIAALLNRIYVLIGHPSAPETSIKHAMKDGLAWWIAAKPLTRKAPAGQPGQGSTSAPILSDARLQRDPIAATKSWVKLHLISFRLHGRDISGNFAPGDKVANAAMEKVESATVSKLGEMAKKGQRVMHYKSVVQYRDPNDHHFPTSVTMTYGEMDAGGTKETSSTTQVVPVQPPPGTRKKQVSLTYSSISELSTVLSGSLAWHMSTGRATILGRGYGSMYDVKRVIREADTTSKPMPADALVQIEQAIKAGDLIIGDR